MPQVLRSTRPLDLPGIGCRLEPCSEDVLLLKKITNRLLQLVGQLICRILNSKYNFQHYPHHNDVILTYHSLLNDLCYKWAVVELTNSCEYAQVG